MAKRKRDKRYRDDAAPDHHSAGEPEAVVLDPERGRKPLLVARSCSAIILLVGLLMLVLGLGVLSGRITHGWGFPMSAVPNWGKPWGLVLAFAGVIYIVGPMLLLIRPKGGSTAMMIVSGLSILVGTPLITTTTEIFYNLFQEPDAMQIPDWADAVWGYFMIVHVIVLVAIYHAHSPAGSQSHAATAG